MSDSKMIYQGLRKVNVSKLVEKRHGLDYLSWAHAWDELLKIHPESTYRILRFTNERTGVTLPYLCDPDLGYMVFTEITIEGLSRSMWMTVMDGANNPLKKESYTYKVKEYVDRKWTGGYIEKPVSAINMFDVNKAIMRCLTKNISMFGLGLNIYAGEDFPEDDQPPAPKPAPAKTTKNKLTAEMFEKAKGFTKAQILQVLKQYTMTAAQRSELTKLSK